MRRLALVATTVVAACAGAPGVVRTPVVPLGAPSPRADVAAERVVRAGADRSPPAPMVEPRAGGDTIVTWRTVTRLVEVPAAPPPEAVSPDPAGALPAAHPPMQPYAPPPEPAFPVGTLVGASIGAAIDCEKGAWIGGTVGFLWDLGRWIH